MNHAVVSMFVSLATIFSVHMSVPPGWTLPKGAQRETLRCQISSMPSTALSFPIPALPSRYTKDGEKALHASYPRRGIDAAAPAVRHLHKLQHQGALVQRPWREQLCVSLAPPRWPAFSGWWGRLQAGRELA